MSTDGSQNKNPKETIVLLDAHALIHRAYHALPAFATSSGEPTGAVYGFLTMILKIMEDFKPEYVVACYDLPGGTFRHEAYADYKKGRKKADDDLVIQLQTSRDVCRAFNIPIYDAPGFEADDILGTLSAQLKDKYNVIIASGDMDTLQLVDDKKVRVFTLRRGIKDTILYDEGGVKERFNFGPELLPDYKGLRGDTSDNIIGIKGIGEKTAQELISKFGSLENLYKVLEKEISSSVQSAGLEGISQRIQKLLIEGKEDALFSKILATIRNDAPITFKEPQQTWLGSLNASVIEEFCIRFEFRSLFARVKTLLNFHSTEDAKSILAKPNNNSEFPSTKSTEKHAQDTLSYEKDRALCIAFWIANPEHAHPTLDEVYMYTSTQSYNEALDILLKKIEKDNMEHVYKDIELPLIPIIKKMKDTGVLIDSNYLSVLSREYHSELDILEKNIFNHAGREFNIRSPKQLGEILFDVLGLTIKGLKKTTGGARSTRESELDKLKGAHPIIELLLRYRELHKLVSTYIDTLPTLVDENGRIHSELLQDGTATGRFSSQNPNIQNIPIRSTDGKKIRNAFVAQNGYELVVCDYSQIELRIAAIMSGDPTLTQALVGGEDIHTAVAARVFGVKASLVDSEQRRRAKIINFGILYGMGVNALQQNLGSTRAEAQEFYDKYFAQFPKIREYMDTTKEFAHKHGYTMTLFGRRRYFAQLKSPLPHIRAAIERTAINAPIQGTGADCIKLAMQYIDKWIENENLSEDVRMILQIHDELVFEVKENKVEYIIPKIENIMSSVLQESWIKYKTPIPLKVTTSVGKSWGMAKE